MKAATVVEPGRLEVIDLPKPKPGPDEALVEVKAVSVCQHADRRLLSGRTTIAFPPPHILGHESAGVVVEVGKNMRDFSPGDRVTMKVRNAMAEFAVARADGMIKIPKHLSFVEAAPLELCMAAWSVTSQSVVLGDKVLIIGMGPAGSILAQMSRVAGASVVAATEFFEPKRRLAEKLGVDPVFAPDTRNLDQKLKKSADNEGFDAVLSTVSNSATNALAAEMVRPHGVLAFFGFQQEPQSVDIFKLHRKCARIVFSGYHDGHGYHAFLRGARLAFEKKISMKPLITHRLPLEKAKKAFTVFEKEADRVLKVIIEI